MANAVETLEAPITLEELQDVAYHLAQNKVPGRDGIPVQFYLILWDQIGPILLEVLPKGLTIGAFNPNISRGISILGIALLAKKGNQLLIENKRGLNFLNCCLKILTKLYQL